ncbi:MAG: hypothetical protein NVSMB52_20280 [Chloroflexota bacterium]
MESPTEREIRERVASYISGRSSLNEFRLWLMPLLWQIDRERDALAFRLATKLALYIAEYGAGHRTDADMRGLFGPLSLPRPQSRHSVIARLIQMPAGFFTQDSQERTIPLV